MSVSWHTCHHCHGVGCEVCEAAGGWFETVAERRARVESWIAWDRIERDRAEYESFAASQGANFDAPLEGELDHG